MKKMKKIRMKVDFNTMDENMCIVNEHGNFIFKAKDISHNDIVFFSRKKTADDECHLITGRIDEHYTKKDLEKEFGKNITFVPYREYRRSNN